MAKAKTITMDDLLSESENIKQLTTGEMIDGVVLQVKKHEVIVDIGSYGVGIIPRREIGYSKSINVGDEISASVVDSEMEDGNVLLSLRKANKDKGWDELFEKQKNKEIIEITPFDANRGGLLVEYDGVRGFLPVSQLSAENYPRVGANDKEEILQKLNGLIGKKLNARVLDCDKKNNKLIFSEKEATKEGLNSKFEKLNIGDIVSGRVTGVVEFGIFLNIDGIEGLVHISEISWERVNNPSDFVKVGQEIQAKIISIDKERISLSIKQLSEDPWLQEVDSYKVGDKVEGTVTRITPFGAFVQISPSVEALVHVSELGKDDNNPEQIFTLNERKEFTILEIEKENRKITLSLNSKSKK